MLKKNLLVLPSWYPSQENKINGSFFQEQAKLLIDYYDTKVLILQFHSRPSLRLITNNPIKFISEYFNYFFRIKLERSILPDIEIFVKPELIEYKTKIFNFSKKNLYKKHISAYLKAFSLLLKSGWKPDLIHAHSADLGGIIACEIKKKYGIPYIITEHMPFLISNYPTHMRENVKHSFQYSDLVLSLGHDMVRQLFLNKIYVEPNILYNLVDENQFSFKSERYTPGNTLRIITIGAASRYKNHSTLFKALSELKKRNIQFHLTLIGLTAYGDIYNDTIELINTFNLNSYVTAIDYVERSEINKYLANHDVYVMTSIFETFCVSIVEALTTGLPVISTNHGGGSLDVINSKNGKIVNIYDFISIADFLEEMYLGINQYDPNLISNHATSICGSITFKNKLLKYYQQVMDNPKH